MPDFTLLPMSLVEDFTLLAMSLPLLLELRPMGRTVMGVPSGSFRNLRP
jgi:hypothetical protein